MKRAEPVEPGYRVTRDMITGLIVSTEYIEHVKDFWRFDLLGDSLPRHVSRWCLDYYQKYHKAPGADIEGLYADHKDNLNPDTADQADMFLQSLSDEFARRDAAQPFNIEYLDERTRQYFTGQAVRRRNEDVSMLIERGEIAKAHELLGKPVPTFGEEAPPEIICAADYEPERREYLLPGYIQLGVPTIVAGRPKIGKGQFTIYLAARVSKGDRWHGIAPAHRAPRGEVLILSAEDRPLKDTIPRLVAAGAERRRVHIMQGERKRADDGSCHLEAWNVRNLSLLRRFLDRHPRCRLVILDPISAYMPRSGERGGSGSNVDVRTALAPLAMLANERNIAVVVVTHLRKGRTGDTLLEQILDSVAYGALARSSLIFSLDPDDSNQRVIVAPEGNYDAKAPSLRYRIETMDVQVRDGGPPQPTEMLVIEGKSDVTEEDLRRKPLDSEDQATYLQVRDWLRKLLSTGPVRQQEVIEQGDEMGYSESQLRRALKRIGGCSAKEKGVVDGPWLWSVPADVKMTRKVAHKPNRHLHRLQQPVEDIEDDEDDVLEKALSSPSSSHGQVDRRQLSKLGRGVLDTIRLDRKQRRGCN